MRTFFEDAFKSSEIMKAYGKGNMRDSNVTFCHHLDSSMHPTMLQPISETNARLVMEVYGEVLFFQAGNTRSSM